MKTCFSSVLSIVLQSLSLSLSLLIRGILSLDEQTQDPAKMEDINYLFEIAHFPGPDWMNLK